MGFFTGRISLVRFRVKGPSPRLFGPEHLERLDQNAIGKQKVVSTEGIEVGWTAGDHILDRAFSLEKNIVNDALHFCLRVDVNKLPSDLLRAYMQEELTAMAAANPSRRPSVRQRREAKTNALHRLEEEAKDGRFLRRRAFPVLWDAPSNELLVGTTAAASLDRLHTLFEQSFGQSFEPLGAGRLAFQLAETRGQTRQVDDARPSPYIPGQSPSEMAWLPEEGTRDFLGNEYLLWLWYMLDVEGDTITLADGSKVAVMLSRTLVLECPRGTHGRETISSDAPTRLPEARKAIQAGRLPRRVGMMLVRHDQQYELTLQAENLAISGAKLPAPESVEERARLEERISQVRHLLETLDLLYDAFCQRRTNENWTRELGRIQRWLQGEERGRKAAIG
jgi:hypothetical protein